METSNRRCQDTYVSKRAEVLLQDFLGGKIEVRACKIVQDILLRSERTPLVGPFLKAVPDCFQDHNLK